MATTIALDPRFPIPDSLSTTDPSHPLQLVKAGIQVQNQAAADSVYDLKTPDRFKNGKKEGFRSPFEGLSDIVVAAALLVFVGIVWLAMTNSMRPLYPLVLLLGFAVLFLLYKKAFD